MNYRKFYEEKTGIKTSKEEDIHHLDCNRENNDIYNLIKIPRKLHKQYHFYLRVVKDYSKLFDNATEEIKTEYRYEIKKYEYFIEKLKEKEKNIYEYVQMRNKQLEVNL